MKRMYIIILYVIRVFESTTPSKFRLSPYIGVVVVLWRRRELSPGPPCRPGPPVGAPPLLVGPHCSQRLELL